MTRGGGEKDDKKKFEKEVELPYQLKKSTANQMNHYGSFNCIAPLVIPNTWPATLQPHMPAATFMYRGHRFVLIKLRQLGL